MKKNKKIMNIVLITIFLTLGFMVRNSSEGILFDMAVLEFIHNNVNETVLAIMKFISFIGSWMFLVPAIGMIVIYFYLKKNYYVIKLLILNTLGSLGFNFILKQIFHRTRPYDFSLVEQGGLSYPSGHSMVTMSLALTIAYLLSRNKSKRTRKNIYAAAGIIISLMGISRMYLGVHWPTDVIGGYIIGYLFSSFFLHHKDPSSIF